MTRAMVGEPVPAVCYVPDVCRHLSMARATFYRRLANGELPVIELVKIGSRRRFDGESVAALKRAGRRV